jgi:hypothetical protein
MEVEMTLDLTPMMQPFFLGVTAIVLAGGVAILIGSRRQAPRVPTPPVPHARSLPGIPQRLHSQLQESYRTHMLADAVGMFGFPVPPRPPNRLTRIISTGYDRAAGQLHLDKTRCF